MDATSTHYLILVAYATLLGGIFGLIGHFWRAWVSSNRDSLYDSPYMLAVNAQAVETRYFEKAIIGADFNDDGSWNGDSFRNMAYLTLAGAAGPFLLGLAGWANRHELLAEACANIVRFGFKPVFCS